MNGESLTLYFIFARPPLFRNSSKTQNPCSSFSVKTRLDAHFAHFHCVLQERSDNGKASLRARGSVCSQSEREREERVLLYEPARAHLHITRSLVAGRSTRGS